MHNHFDEDEDDMPSQDLRSLSSRPSGLYGEKEHKTYTYKQEGTAPVSSAKGLHIVQVRHVWAVVEWRELRVDHYGGRNRMLVGFDKAVLSIHPTEQAAEAAAHAVLDAQAALANEARNLRQLKYDAAKREERRAV